MSLYTYDGLVSEIASWSRISVNDLNFISRIPTFIALAEQQLFMDCTTLGNQSYVLSQFTPGQSIIEKPVGWGRTISLSYFRNTQTVYLQRQTVEYNEMFHSAINVSGIPQYYSDYGYDQIQVLPAPDLSYSFRLAYYVKIPPLTRHNTENWYTRNAYDILFYSCMDKAMTYQGNSNLSALYHQKYQERLAMISNYDKERLLDRYSDAIPGQIPGSH